MPIIRRTETVGANATVRNLLAGSTFEYPPWNAQLLAGVTAAAAGMEITVITGSDVIQEEAEARIRTAYPVMDEDMDISDVVGAGQRLVFQARNTTGAGIVVRTICELTPF